ncbi:MAG: DNA-deoxyinosine glycosylase, partial [Pseudomonadota bacterium]
LERYEYYANPRNVFWRLMTEIFGMPAAMDYSDRARTLVAKGIGVWDVLASSSRRGSLDADIDLRTATANDFDRFFREHPAVARVFFNGRKAGELFARLGCEASLVAGQELLTLPSTSPAFAAMPYAKKLAKWKVVAERASP